jgi:hypothetical protein
VALTILVARNGIVTANFALVQPSLAVDAPRVLSEVVKLIGGQVPTLEELGVPGAMQGGRAARAESDEQLGTLIRALIRQDATPEEVDRAAAAVEAYVKDRPAAQAALGRATRTIVKSGKLLGYGIPRAQEFLRTWAERYGKGEKATPPDRPDADREKDR